MPIFVYACDQCNEEFESIVITRQSSFQEPTECPICHSKEIHKIISQSPPTIRMDGRIALQTLADPKMPLQSLKEKGPREGCEGGYADLPEVGKLERVKTKDGNWEWREVKRQYFDLKGGKN